MINLVIDNTVANIVLDKPPLNIFSYKDITRMASIVNSINNEDKVKLVVIKSANSNFSAGMDIKEHDKENIHNILISLEHLIEALINIKYPTISLVQGYCFGGGLEIALFTDIILASKNAKFALPEIKLAHLPPFGISILPSIISDKTAAEFILSGESINAEDALSIGMISKIVDDSEFLQSSSTYTNNLQANSYRASYITTKILRSRFRQAMDYYKSNVKPFYTYDVISHSDANEGIEAYLEHRNPVWEK